MSGSSLSSTSAHPFANSSKLVEIIPGGIDVEEEARLYEELSHDDEYDARSIISIPVSFQGPPSVFSKDIWLGDNSGESLAFTQDVKISGWTHVGDKPEGGYIGFMLIFRGVWA
ncbi:hypothetical protein H0H81_004610 [Sphagnurus paluster]|uniref:Uncharacterized protein n=1 Tax=Sphagnurus paluster TaxID=117069 RepID=A0A9P7GMJ4_9AGAR|nr:hypothetical protein H0H81_004610 [Sphagnurus paluster]